MHIGMTITCRSHAAIYNYYARQNCIDESELPKPTKTIDSCASSTYSDSSTINEKMIDRAMNIAVVVCSSRQTRVCPQIADFVVDTIKKSKSYQAAANKPTISIVDLQKWNLPMFDEPGIPSRIFSSKDYEHQHTRDWSEEIQKYDSFIFVTPQYNWGYPAVLKNAIDYLYNEWKGKTATIITYGGHGGDKCSAQLRQVLAGVKMLVTQRSVQLTYPSKDILVKACSGQSLDLDANANSGTWIADQKNIQAAYEELVSLPNVSAGASKGVLTGTRHQLMLLRQTISTSQPLKQ